MFVVLLYDLILPIYNDSDPPQPTGMLIFPRTSVKSPVAEAAIATQLTGSIHEHPSPLFEEDTVNPKPGKKRVLHILQMLAHNATACTDERDSSGLRLTVWRNLSARFTLQLGEN